MLILESKAAIFATDSNIELFYKGSTNQEVVMLIRKDNSRCQNQKRAKSKGKHTVRALRGGGLQPSSNKPFLEAMSGAIPNLLEKLSAYYVDKSASVNFS